MDQTLGPRPVDPVPEVLRDETYRLTTCAPQRTAGAGSPLRSSDPRSGSRRAWRTPSSAPAAITPTMPSINGHSLRISHRPFRRLGTSPPTCSMHQESLSVKCSRDFPSYVTGPGARPVWPRCSGVPLSAGRTPSWVAETHPKSGARQPSRAAPWAALER